MTRAAFLATFAWALIERRPEVLTATPPIYPSGPLIRLKVQAPWDTRVPPLVDPIGLIWLSTHGRLRGVQQAYLMATSGLGMTAWEALDCIEASDKGRELLTPSQAAWRLGLLDVLEAYRTDILSPSDGSMRL